LRLHVFHAIEFYNMARDFECGDGFSTLHGSHSKWLQLRVIMKPRGKAFQSHFIALVKRLR
jgi:hypothetical protein